MRRLVCLLVAAWQLPACGSTGDDSLTGPTPDDATPSDAAADTGLPLDDAGPKDDATSSADAASDGPAPAEGGSRCTVTLTTVFCEHNVSQLVVSPTVVRNVYWQMPLGAPPAAGFPVVVMYQGSFFGPALTWGTLASNVPFGGFHQGLLQARLLDHGFIVVAPEAAGAVAWQTNSGVARELTTDSLVVEALLAAIEKGSYGPADTTHLYATGISSGGYMTSRMAVSYAGRFRALAIASGSYATCLGPVCNVPATLPADHPPTLFMHGSLDTTVPIATMQPYHDGLVTQGVATDLDVDPSAGHEWLKDAPERVTTWFEGH